jgi:hypothetical protein
VVFLGVFLGFFGWVFWVGFLGWVFYCQPCEKALPEIDKRLNVELELRKLARKEGRRYCDPVALTYQSERMPEPLRSKVGQVPTVQVPTGYASP